MAITLTTATKNAACNAITALANVSSPGKFEIATSSAFTTLLAQMNLAATAFATASGGSASLNSLPIQDTSANNTGTATDWRITDGAGTKIMSGPVATTATGADIVLTVAVQNAALNAVTALIGASGKVQLTTAGDTGFASPLVSLTLNATAFAAASGSSAVMNTGSAVTGTATASGTATLFRFTDSAGTTEVFRGAVGTSGTEIVLDTNIIANGVPVTLSSFTLSLPGTFTDAASVGVLVINTTSIVTGGLVSVSSFSFAIP